MADPARHRAGRRRDAAARAGRRRGPRRRRRLGSGADVHGAGAAFRLRLGAAMGAPHGRRPLRDRRPGRGLAAQRRAHRARARPVGRPFRGAGRAAGAVRADLHRVPRSQATRGRRAGSGGRYRAVLDRVDRALRLPGRLARRGAAVAGHAQGADLRPDRWRGGRSDDVAARAAGRAAQLGLPLLLAARRHVHPAGTGGHRLRRGGEGLAGLVAARVRRRPCRLADHVRARRQPPDPGVHPGLAVRLRSFHPGPGR